ncbi:MAG: carboxyl transferase domain-containing protein [Actinomycetota bacterium]
MEEAQNGAHDLALGLADPGSFEVRQDGLRSRDPLGYPGYGDALAAAAERAKADESVVTGMATIEGHRVELAAFQFDFLGGSMGEVAGERLARAMEMAAKRRVPFVLRTATGGARMQEGMRSLIQMPKVVSARMLLADAHEAFIAVLGHPTTGGVFASLGSLADVTLAEDNATIGFAGPRVAESFTGSPLPKDSHTSSSALSHGLVDAVIDRASMRTAVGEVLDCLAPAVSRSAGADQPEISDTEIDAWEALQRARSPQRLSGRRLVDAVTERFTELRGDRAGSDDPAVIAGLGRVDGRPLVVIALDPAHAPNPAGFRKTLRCLDVARRLDLPLVTFVDTPGADPSAPSEAAGVAGAIARLFEAMLAAPVPTLAVVTGEGGSGGALAFATTDRVVAFEDAVFSVIGPEGAAQILWRDPSRAPEAARVLKLTALDLHRLGIADHVHPGPLDATNLRRVVTYHLDVLIDERPRGADPGDARRQRWRKTW